MPISGKPEIGGEHLRMTVIAQGRWYYNKIGEAYGAPDNSAKENGGAEAPPSGLAA